VHSNNPANEDNLKKSILDAVASISPAQLLSAMNSVLVHVCKPTATFLNMVDTNLI
jgi:uncharacterized membrane protein